MAGEGLRERKKRQTRQHISDIATGLFLEHGFVTVTIADIASAADVSVNTVYNYFGSKEELFLDREDDAVEWLASAVRGRRAGESPAVAVLRALRAEVVAVSPRVGLIDGYERFMRVIEESQALRSRVFDMRRRAIDLLTDVLTEEAGEAEEAGEESALLPALVAGQLGWIQAHVVEHIQRELVAGRTAAETSRSALVVLDAIEGMLSDRLLEYGTRPAAV
ncbi:TetR/AcrR family transcriptional regulator [Streptomyces luteoverticillatus]|uniref:TetR/AcrR family transcriptional regulator n=1 Tax=Streptomyces luteoverticillatus TaxID=66425 RepID=A0A3Q9FYB2_STRLT|nr:TetR/AcrR family transcriptional regulator [Streptomyces luteoverticillatus]AZQ73586.1 TetR/AcrR family transcriptional regulator [Streptomyces luteoverticillatus]